MFIWLQLPEDSLNWMYFKMMGKKVILKQDVVPHKNMYPVDEVSDKAEPVPSQLNDSTRKRKAEYLDSSEVSSNKKTKIVLFEDVEQATPSKKTATSCASTSYQSSPSRLFTVQSLQNHVGIQVRPKVKSQFTSTQNLIQVRSVGTLTKVTAYLPSQTNWSSSLSFSCT